MDHRMKKRSFTSETKVRLVLEVLREERTISEIAAEQQINPNQLANWKREFMERAPSVFDETKQVREQRKAEKTAELEKAEMFKTIGQLTMERDFLKAATEKLSDRRLL